MTNNPLSRRTMMCGTAAAGGLLMFGFTGSALAAAAKPKIVMQRSPTCGCCIKWADAARAAGFDVTVTETDDIMAVKRRLGVPGELTSCHTSLAGGYVIEGHVPLDAVKKLLRTRPKIKGIGVAGMPIGAPGMEVPGRAAEAIKVLAFDAAGKVRPFA